MSAVQVVLRVLESALRSPAVHAIGRQVVRDATAALVRHIQKSTRRGQPKTWTHVSSGRTTGGSSGAPF
jgi:hypothetical protein